MRRFTKKYFAASILSNIRGFNTYGRVGNENEFGNTMRDISVVTGTPKPATHEGNWKCRFDLNERLPQVVRKLLQEKGWNELEIKRETDEMFSYSRGKSGPGNFGSWATVEEFQRTPWYRRYRPNDGDPLHFISFEVFQILEDAIIPPSQRGDPYAHLRKRHFEDAFTTERFSEEAAQHITREKMAKHTKGMPQHGTYGGRKAFVKFEEEYKQNHVGKCLAPGEIYQAWKASMDDQ